MIYFALQTYIFHLSEFQSWGTGIYIVITETHYQLAPVANSWTNIEQVSNKTKELYLICRTRCPVLYISILSHWLHIYTCIYDFKHIMIIKKRYGEKKWKFIFIFWWIVALAPWDIFHPNFHFAGFLKMLLLVKDDRPRTNSRICILVKIMINHRRFVPGTLLAAQGTHVFVWLLNVVPELQVTHLQPSADLA